MALLENLLRAIASSQELSGPLSTICHSFFGGDALCASSTRYPSPALAALLFHCLRSSNPRLLLKQPYKVFLSGIEVAQILSGAKRCAACGPGGRRNETPRDLGRDSTFRA